jgi:hypothetical protein
MDDQNAKENFKAPAELDRFQVLALGVGVIGMLALIAGAFLGFGGLEQALRSYLLGYIFWTGIAVGCIGILILQHLTGGSWGLVIRRILEAGAKTWWLLLLMFLPIMFGATRIYEWAAYQAEGHSGSGIDKILDHKAAYLNINFFSARAILYFLTWGAITYFLTKWSQQQDETGDWKLSSSMNRFSGPAMIAFVVAVTFAAIDWTMSLDPHWYSTMYGLLFVIGFALSSMAFVIAVSAWLAGREPMNHVLGAPHFHDLGKLMLAMTMIWGYFNLSQLIIIWSGNLPEETPWYLRRTEGSWGIVGLLLVLLHFALPFLLLLSQDIKRRSKWLATIAVFVLVMRVVDLFYLIAPNPNAHGEPIYKNFNLSWMDLVAPLAVGGIWLAAFIWFYKQRPIMPYNDPFFENAVAHGVEHH